MSGTPIGVLVVDDDALARQAVRTIVDADDGLLVVGEAGDGREAVERAARSKPQVVLMDIRMPGGDGIEALTELKRRHPDLPVVMVTTFSDHELVQRALAGGAAGFLLKTSGPDELVHAVHSAHAGGLVMSPSVSRWVVEQWTSSGTGGIDARTRLARLTERQDQVLQLLAEGDSNAEIGRRLHLSEGTVKGYVSEIISALQVRNRVEAAVLLHRGTTAMTDPARRGRPGPAVGCGPA